MRRAKARTRRPRSTKADIAVGRLVVTAVLSWLVYVVLANWTAAPEALAVWCSGLVVGLLLSSAVHAKPVGRR